MGGPLLLQRYQPIEDNVDRRRNQADVVHEQAVAVGENGVLVTRDPYSSLDCRSGRTRGGLCPRDAPGAVAESSGVAANPTGCRATRAQPPGWNVVRGRLRSRTFPKRISNGVCRRTIGASHICPTRAGSTVNVVFAVCVNHGGKQGRGSATLPGMPNPTQSTAAAAVR
jgi:hypothetical protein